MRTTELFRTCANEHVAAAALACIGGKLERRVTAAARRAGLPAGAFVVELVADYDRKASPNCRKALEMGMVRQDMPILAGLRHVVEMAMEGAWEAAREGARSGPASEVAERRHLRWETGTRSLLRGQPQLKRLYS